MVVYLVKMRHLLFALVAILSPVWVLSQETNYLYNNFGPAAFIKGGVEVAGSRSTSAIYYNPGALAFSTGTFIEAQADVFGFDLMQMDNGAGEGIPIRYINFDVVPSFVGFTNQTKNEKLVFGVSSMVKLNSRINFFADHVFNADLIAPDTNEETFEGTYAYRNNLRETWVSGALGYRLTENIGLGFSTNITIRIQDFQRAYNAAVFPARTNNTQAVTPDRMANFQRNERLELRATGLVFKGGINADYGDKKFGLTITAPNLSVPVLRNRSTRQIVAVMPDNTNNAIYASGVYDFWQAEYRTPWIIDLGAEFKVSESTQLSLMVNWYSKVGTYSMLNPWEQSIAYGTALETMPDFANPKMANKSLINAGAAVSVQLKDNLYYGGSFRTDFNYFDHQALDYINDYVPSFTFWDIYHVTSGFAWTGEKTSLSAGVNLGMGFSKGDRQLVNMTTARQDNLLEGDRNTNTKTNYLNASFVISISYSVTKVNTKSKNK